MSGIQLTLVVIGTGCTGSCKSNYNMIMTTMTPLQIYDKDMFSHEIKSGKEGKAENKNKLIHTENILL
jgi:hypothetical protein